MSQFKHTRSKSIFRSHNIENTKLDNWPTPVQLEALAGKVHLFALVCEKFTVEEVQRTISMKDPRTVANYPHAIEDLRLAIYELQQIVEKMKWLEE